MITRSLAKRAASSNGGIAQLGERLLCKQEVVGSIPSASTITHARRYVRHRTRRCPMGDAASFFDIVYRKRSESLNIPRSVA